MPRGKASFDTMNGFSVDVKNDTGFHGGKKLETDLFKDKDFKPAEELDPMKNVATKKEADFDTVVNKIMELDDSLVVKGRLGDIAENVAAHAIWRIPEALGATAGAAVGAGTGALSAKEGERLEGAKRGAIAGGVTGAVGGNLSKRAVFGSKNKEINAAYDRAERYNKAGEKRGIRQFSDDNPKFNEKREAAWDDFQDTRSRVARRRFAGGVAAAVPAGVAAGASTRMKKDEDDVSKGFSRLDDSLVVKGSSLGGERLAKAAIGAVGGSALGAGTGALVSDKDKRLEGAKRGAIAGGLTGGAATAAGHHLALRRAEHGARKVIDELSSGKAKTLEEMSRSLGKIGNIPDKYSKDMKKTAVGAGVLAAGAGVAAANNKPLKEKVNQAKDTLAENNVAYPKDWRDKGYNGLVTKCSGRKQIKVKDGFSEMPEDLKTKDGYSELPDDLNVKCSGKSPLKVKGIGGRLAESAVGAAGGSILGAATGAASADSDKRLEGAKRGAAVGGTLGAATPLAYGRLSKTGINASTLEKHASGMRSNQNKLKKAAATAKSKADVLSFDNKTSEASELRGKARGHEAESDWYGNLASRAEQNAKVDRSKTRKRSALATAGTSSFGGSAAGATTRVKDSEEKGYRELDDTLVEKAFLKPISESPILNRVKRMLKPKPIATPSGAPLRAAGSGGAVLDEAGSDLFKQQEAAKKLRKANQPTTPVEPPKPEVATPDTPSTENKPGFFRRNRAGILTGGALVGAGVAAPTAMNVIRNGPNTGSIEIKKGLVNVDDEIVNKAFGLKPVSESPILAGVKKIRQATSDFKNEAAKATRPDTKPAGKPETWKDIAGNVVSGVKREVKARVGEAKQGKAVYDLARNGGMSRSEAINEVKRIRDLNPDGPPTPVSNPIKYGIGGAVIGGGLVGAGTAIRSKKDKALSMDTVKHVAIGAGTGLLGSDLANRLQDRRNRRYQQGLVEQAKEDAKKE